MSKIIEFLKAHPYGSAIGAAALVGGYILLKSNSGTASTVDDGSTYVGADAATVVAASQLQLAQVGANQAALQSNNQAAVAEFQVTGQETIAALQSQDTLAGITASQAVQTNADNLSAQTTQAVSALQATVAENQIAAGVQTAQINANAYVSIAEAPYASADYIAGLNANSNNAATALAVQQIANFAQGEVNSNTNQGVDSNLYSQIPIIQQLQTQYGQTPISGKVGG